MDEIPYPSLVFVRQILRKAHDLCEGFDDLLEVTGRGRIGPWIDNGSSVVTNRHPHTVKHHRNNSHQNTTTAANRNAAATTHAIAIHISRSTVTALLFQFHAMVSLHATTPVRRMPQLISSSIFIARQSVWNIERTGEANAGVAPPVVIPVGDVSSIWITA
jgi:hypothetical protein